MPARFRTAPLFATLLLAQGAALTGALAQTAGDPPPGAGGARAPGAAAPPGVAGDWRLALGVGAVLRPDYLGSSDLTVTALPQVDLRYRDIAFLSTFGGLPGLGANLLRSGGLLAGPVVRLRFPRDAGTNATLRGLGDIGWVAEAGGFLDYRTERFRVAAEVRAGLGAHQGVVADLRAEAILRPRPGLTLSAGPRLSLASRDFTDTYFGISPAQALRSGYAPFRPSGGVVTVGAGAFANQAVTERLSLQAVVDYARLTDAVSDSPIVRSANQWVGGLSATYAFSW